MNNVLRIDASMRSQASHGRRLLDYLVSQFYSETSKIQRRDLTEGLPFIDEAWIQANFTDADARTEQQKSTLALSDALVAELRNADTILLSAPIYNFQLPAAFKAWIDLVARARETFKYTPNGPVGLLQNKRAIVVLTSGGTKLGSDIDFVSGYLRHVFSFIGIDDLTIIDASGIGRDEQGIIANARQQIDALTF